jgi:ElaB/YqjD/DUF883 family membrane-anchored ribosome-binding protein
MEAAGPRSGEPTTQITGGETPAPPPGEAGREQAEALDAVAESRAGEGDDGPDAKAMAAKAQAAAQQQLETVRQHTDEVRQRAQAGAVQAGAQAQSKFDERPELFVAGAFLGGLVLAQLLKRLGSG